MKSSTSGSGSWGLGFRLWGLGVGVWALGAGLCVAQINMPDPALIHGRAIPAPELPNGTVTVRVVREAIGKNQRWKATARGSEAFAKYADVQEFLKLLQD